MGSSSQTQTSQPPKWQRPYIEYGMGQARNIYDSGHNVVAPISGETETGLKGIQSIAGNNGFTGAATGLAQNTLNGGFLNSNPYLDQTFNRAAMATQGQLASQFAGAGRNVDASEGLRSQQLNDLASQIYGGNYQAERDRQQQTLAMSPQLNQGQYADFDRMLGVGAAREGYNQQQLDAPGIALDRYLGRVGGGYGSSVKTAGGGSPWAGLLGAGILGGLF